MEGGLAAIAFDGIEGIEGGEFTLQHGPDPSIANIRCSPQAKFPNLNGTLTISQNGETVRMKNCRIDESSIAYRGAKVNLRILDRRWKWRYGAISGRYNVYKDDGTLDKDTELAPQHLAAKCATVMREPNMDVSHLPTDARPTCIWDHEAPARALATLCDQLGFRIVLGTDDRVRLLPVGVGALLSADGTTSDGGDTLNPPEMPDTIRFIGLPNIFEWDFYLIPVGKDTDGQWKFINSLSYAPEDGWATVDLEGDFNEVADETARELAKATVFKYYRVWPTDLTTNDIEERLKAFNKFLKIEPFSSPIERAWQIEWLSHQARMTTGANGERHYREPMLYGNFYDGHEAFENTIPAAAVGLAGDLDGGVKPLPSEPATDAEKKQVFPPGSYFIDQENLMVGFHEPVYTLRQDGNETYYNRAYLRLRIAFRMREFGTFDSGGYVHTDFSQPTGAANNTPAMLVRSSDIARVQYPQFQGEFDKYQIQTNDDEFKREAQSHIDAALRRLTVERPQTMTWERIRNISPDGAIQVVTWRVGGGGLPSTTAHRNNDLSTPMPSYAERRFRQKTAEAASFVDGIKKLIDQRIAEAR